ncbi:hypothetical protein [Methylobacterium gnaphalii]|uniref:Uncharacterized protein n=1 Tax=Methylobacterium gnaphalii TaxID=1010610 RepID=A0A512JPS9_9HYPH|nr:hypothetical protein [Methylobacterium gnaphalii]GEP11949.1 hypothetical protein MGN01_37940 [Methylobacterium gnaphalii]GJD68702.1 hypothetical protein MMMDOFMJ_1626 [Methylobacterium gnaphalii]GLS49401.1 hypothetical protein GCM10007885_22490 [Methylobacterium gnaphalii]
MAEVPEEDLAKLIYAATFAEEALKAVYERHGIIVARDAMGELATAIRLLESYVASSNATSKAGSR